MKKQLFNPYLPGWEYLPDGEPHVFDGRLYIFGSHDRFGADDFCLNDYITWSAPVSDLSDWRYEGVIFRKDQTPWNTDLKPLYAPDVCQGPDGRYYLYYSVQNSCITSVAVCDTPAGDYEYLGDVRFPDGRIHGSAPEDWFNFDPAILVDTDGRIFLYSGSGQPSNGKFGHEVVGSFVMELEQDMLTIKDGPNIVLPKDWDRKKPGYFEGTSVRHIGDWYYLVYPTSDMTGLNYSMSRYPDRDFVWKGPIHCTSDIGINGDKNLAHAKYPFGNNHGGLVEINGQWYIFDHRMTSGSIFARQGVAEPVEIYENGTIRMIEATSQGLYGKPLPGKGTYPAWICCNLFIANRLLPVPPYGKAAGAWVTQDGPDYEPADPKNPGKDPGPAPQSFVHVQKKNVLIGYKYFDLEKNSEITLRSRGKGSGEIEILTDPEGPVLASVPIRPSADWVDGAAALTLPSVGKTALFFRCKVKGGCDLLEFTLQ